MAFFIAIAVVITRAEFDTTAATTPDDAPDAWSVQAFGRALLDDFNVAFELLSVVLLLAIVGAISIAARDEDRHDPAIDESTEG